MKRLIYVFFLVLLGCSPSEEEVKAEIDNLYSEIKRIPISDPCGNFEGYKKLQSLENERETSYYSEIVEEKVSIYGISCTKQLKDEEERSKLGDWSYGNYADESGMDTGDGYIQLEVLGKFSNATTTNSNLRVEMFIDNGYLKRNKPFFRLYEYDGTGPVIGIHRDANPVACRFKHELSGSTYKLGLYQEQGWDYLLIKDRKNYLILKDIIKKEERVKFSCHEERNRVKKYNFDLDFKYYANALRQYNISTSQ